MPLPKLSEAQIRRHSGAEVFARGEGYARRGAVESLVLRGDTLHAEVQGSEDEPYDVQVLFDANGVTMVSCDCPYAYGGWCKHVVAALLMVANFPETVETRPPLEQQLAGLGREQMQDLLLRLAERNNNLADAIDREVALLNAKPAPQAAKAASVGQSATPARQAAIDAKPFQRQVRALLSDFDPYHDGGETEEALEQIVRQADTLTQAGNGRGALSILTVVGDELIEHWYQLMDSEADMWSFSDALGEALAAALLTADHSADERRAWRKKLKEWDQIVAEYDVGSFEVAVLAAEQGWDDPALRHVLAGDMRDRDVVAGEDESSERLLATLRIDILGRQGRAEEALRLAEAVGLVGRQALMLAQLGLVDEAVKIGLKQLKTADEAAALVQTLRELGENDGALQVAEHGLSLAEPRAALAGALVDFAKEQGRADLALRAADVAFRSTPNLDAYVRLQTMAGERWPELRESLLTYLRAGRASWTVAPASVDIFLYEELYDDAIAVVEHGTATHLLQRVVDAAIVERPDWAIKAAARQAESIMDAGRSQSYDEAVEWLRRVQAAYAARGLEADWRAYFDGLRAKHARKYKLMELMQKLEVKG